MKRFFYSFLFILFLTFRLSALVIETSHLEEIEKEMMHIDDQTLVVFDVDLTLIVPTDHVLSPCGDNYIEMFSHEIQGKLGAEKQHELMSQVLRQCNFKLIDKNILLLLTELREKNIKTIALTALMTGHYGVIPNMEDWRIQQLCALGIHFENSFPQLPFKIFNEFQGKGPPPVFKQGILCSASYSKGSVLLGFLKYLHWKPSKVIFIDDRKECITSVESTLEKEHIPHISFHYTGAYLCPHPIDERIANFQMTYLLQHEIWLSDEDAKCYLDGY